MRVDVVTAFQQAGATAVAADADPLAPSLYHADDFALVPRAEDRRQLDFFLGYTPVESFVQECCLGEEFSIDVLCDFEGRCLNAIPRTMILSKGGESIQGRTIKDPELIEAARLVAESLPLK